MGRPSKLPEKAWDDIRSRLLAGEKAADLAREYKISRSTISERLSERVGNIKDVANQIVAAEQNLRSLPVVEQVAALTLADELRSISMHLASAAKNGAATACRLSRIAGAQALLVDEQNPMESQETLQAISALTKIANEAAATGMGLVGRMLPAQLTGDGGGPVQSVTRIELVALDRRGQAA